MNREEAWAIVQEHTTSESLRKHMLAVEAAMRAYARHFGEDEERWGVAGLLHDFDWEAHPEEHPSWGVAYLRDHGVDEELLQGILAHAPHTNEPRETLLARTLFAVDELCGLITAATLVRPDRDVRRLEASSVVKRMKDKAFARGVNRDDLRAGAQTLGLPLEEHVGNVLSAMQERAGVLGLAG